MQRTVLVLPPRGDLLRILLCARAPVLDGGAGNPAQLGHLGHRPRQRIRHGVAVDIADFEVPRQRRHDHFFQLGRDACGQRAGARNLGLEHAADDDEVVGPAKQPPPRQHLVQHNACAENVRRWDDLLRHLLRRHIGQLALDDAGPRLRSQPTHRLGHAEVDDFYLAFDGHHDVLGRDIAVNDGLHFARRCVLVGVGMTQTASDLTRDVGGNPRRQALPGKAARGDTHELPQRVPPNVLADDKRHLLAELIVGGLQQRIDPRQVRMLHRAHELGFV